MLTMGSIVQLVATAPKAMDAVDAHNEAPEPHRRERQYTASAASSAAIVAGAVLGATHSHRVATTLSATHSRLHNPHPMAVPWLLNNLACSCHSQACRRSQEWVAVVARIHLTAIYLGVQPLQSVGHFMVALCTAHALCLMENSSPR